LSKINYQDLSLAVRAAQQALSSDLASRSRVEAVVDREWKIGADWELESVILQVLQEESIYPVLTEEAGTIEGEGERRWVVDPLDGSANYSREIPFSAISIGL
jgi:myo-inositol-1(or 4)-monophosphatase